MWSVVYYLGRCRGRGLYGKRLKKGREAGIPRFQEVREIENNKTSSRIILQSKKDVKKHESTKIVREAESLDPVRLPLRPHLAVSRSRMYH